MSKSLPEKPNLEHLKAQAKDLLDSFQSQDPAAKARIQPYFPDESELKLTQSQFVLAREYGFDSWAKLTDEITTKHRSDLGERLVKLAAKIEGDLTRAQEILSLEPLIGEVSLAAACVVGDLASVKRLLLPTQVNEKVGPEGWEPILYVCFSCFLRDPARRDSVIETGRYLLGLGASAKAFWTNPQYDECPETCLYGATGVNDCPELARLLLEAGATPNDGESLYHSAELPRLDCLRVLVEFGADVVIENGMARKLDFEDREGIQLLLSSAKDRSRIPMLIPHAIRRGRGIEIIGDLINSGMNLEATVDEGLTAYRFAMRMGRNDVMNLLEQAGVNTGHTPADRLLHQIATGNQPSPSDFTPEIIAELDGARNPVLVMVAEHNRPDLLEILLKGGLNPNVSDQNGTYPLNQAAWNASPAAVRVLLDHGANPANRDRIYNGTAIEWACHSSYRPEKATEAYITIIEMLLGAGTPLPQLALGSSEVQAYLVQRGSSMAPA